MRNLLRLLLLIAVLGIVACGTQETSDSNTADTSETEEEPTVTMKVNKEVTYSIDTLDMKGYIAYPQNADGPRPGVLVVHEWWGHNDYARKRADMLAELGYVAMAVDMYGDGRQAAHPKDAQKFAMSVMGDFEVAKARFEKAMETLKNDSMVDGEKMAAIGYCFGGGVVLNMANTGADLDAVASFHGSLGMKVEPEKGKTKAKVLVMNGAADPFVSAEQIGAYTAAMDAAEADYQFINYEGATHGFTAKEADENGKKFDLPLAYDAEADEQSWTAMKE
ncbi:MAG: dienelactone hydrolase family protein, partial [Bacteroidota bacterium]